MLTKDEIQSLLHSTEAYRVERTVSTGNMDKFCEAICAFANLFVKPCAEAKLAWIMPWREKVG